MPVLTVRDVSASPPPRHNVTRRARLIAESLRPPGAVREPDAFDPSMVDGLPEPARRWLTHAIAPGTPLVDAVEIHMHGKIKLGRWRPFTATQAIVASVGYVWAARTRVGGIPVRGFDSYAHGEGTMRWRALGILPVQSADGADVTRSAAGRLASEACLLPSSLLSATWEPDDNPNCAVFVQRSGGCEESERVTVYVAPDGRLLAVTMPRWGSPNGGAFARHRFEVRFDAECTAGGMTLPDLVHASWIGADGRHEEFYRASIDAADFLTVGPPANESRAK
jgi:hypothetical protein